MFIYPGLIDAHAHFYGYSQSLQRADLVGTKSWEEVLAKVISFSQEQREGWIMGRGWDQNDWAVKAYPSKEGLDHVFPERPVLLQRVDGHAAIANSKALEIAGIKAGDKLNGGVIEVKNGELTGLLIDNAVDLVTVRIPPPSSSQIAQAFDKAQANCFAAGLTTIDDCGLAYEQVELIDSLQKTGRLKMRLYVMLSDVKKNYDYLLLKGRIKTEKLNVRSFKVYADGSLGSRGACLLEPYADKPGHVGFLLSSQAHFDSVARLLHEKGFQMCTHAIGDSGNRTMLNIYAKYLKGKNDLRWRIEHAQVVNERDFEMFGAYSIIPSVQPTHATSDMYWAVDRIGTERAKGSYAYKKLLQENGWIPLGTDAPVEDISPLRTFYAAVFRKDREGHPEGGFQAGDALSREEALKGMTIWAASANFEDGEKGSLETGKVADFIMLREDLMKANEQSILNMKVARTYLNGELVYSGK
jgi:predicted amidohydrolase YtcJ